MAIKLNGNIINKFELVGSYKKSFIYLINNNMVLTSYDSYICILSSEGVLINNLDKYKYSLTTKRHYKNFLTNQTIKKEINLNETEFMKVIETLFNEGVIKTP